MYVLSQNIKNIFFFFLLKFSIFTAEKISVYCMGEFRLICRTVPIFLNFNFGTFCRTSVKQTEIIFFSVQHIQNLLDLSKRPAVFCFFFFWGGGGGGKTESHTIFKDNSHHT